MKRWFHFFKVIFLAQKKYMIYVLLALYANKISRGIKNRSLIIFPSKNEKAFKYFHESRGNSIILYARLNSDKIILAKSQYVD